MDGETAEHISGAEFGLYASADICNADGKVIVEKDTLLEVAVSDENCDAAFVKVAQSKGIGKQLLDYMKKVKSTLRLNIYQKNERAIQFYLREEFRIKSGNVDDNTGEKEFIMVWNH